MKYINFNDETIPIGKRKQAYVKWAVSKGTDIDSSQLYHFRFLSFIKSGAGS